MSARPCPGCGTPVADAYLCPDCGGELQDQLWGVGALVDDLDITLCRLARVGDDGAGIRVRSAETPLVFNWAAAEALVMLHGALAAWAATIADTNAATVVVAAPLVPVDPRDPARIFPPRGRAAALAGWLAERVDWVRAHPDVGELVEQVGYAIRCATSVIDRRAERAYAGPCQADTEDGLCPTDLYAHPRAHTVRCPDCDAEHDMAARREWLLRAVLDQLVTAAEASRALPGLLGQPVTASQIRGHAFRGHLAAHPPDPRLGRDAKGREQSLYRLGEIVDVLVAEAEPRRKESRMSTAETIPAPPDVFANPYLLCVQPSCQQRVTNVAYPGAVNVPCGHAGVADVCPSWGPVDGCTCVEPHGPARDASLYEG